MRYTVKIRYRADTGTWTLDYLNPEGRRRQLSGGKDEQQARRLAVRFQDWLLEGRDPENEIKRQQVLKESTRITLKAFFSDFRNLHGSHQSDRTQQLYETSFRNFSRCPQLANSSLDNISRGLVMDYLNARMKKEGISGRTANIELGHLSLMLDLAVDMGKLERNPLRGMKKFKEAGKRDVSLSEEQAEALLNNLKSPLREIVAFAMLTGLRKGNILNLRIEQVVFSDIQSIGILNLVVKGGKRKAIPIGPEAVKLLKKVIASRREGYVFLNPKTGEPFVSIHKPFNDAVRALGLTAEDGSKLRFHDLRHYRASFWRAAGASLEDIQIALGHENRATTERYITPDVAAVGARLSKIKRPSLKGL